MSEKFFQDFSQYLRLIQARTLLFFDFKDIEKISHLTVVLAGIGGVGALVLELLARWGIRRFKLIDMDVYSASNMNRQIFATTHNLGKPKVEVAAERIKQINPFSKVEIFYDKLTHDNTPKLLSGADVIFREADLPSATILLHYYAKKIHVPLITGHTYKITAAIVTTFDYRNPKQRSIDEPTPFYIINCLLHRYLKLFKNEMPYIKDEFLEKKDQKIQTSASLNFVTNLAACLAVSEFVKLFLNKGQCILYPKYIYIDPINLKFKIGSYTYQKIVNFIKKYISNF